MISGERSANWASSFLRSAGASWAAAALRCRTRPARTSSTAGSGIPATTALTAAVSTGLTPRTSSREVTTLCSRHGTRAAAAMQANTAAARSGDSSPNPTRNASASPAVSRIIAECRNRSGHGEKNDVEEWGASMAIGPLSPGRGPRNRLNEPDHELISEHDLFGTPVHAFPDHASCSSGASVAPLSHIGGFARRLGIKSRRRPARGLDARAQYNLTKRQQDYRYDKWGNIIEDAKQQHSGQQVFPVHLPQPDQHGGVEHPEPD